MGNTSKESADSTATAQALAKAMSRHPAGKRRVHSGNVKVVKP